MKGEKFSESSSDTAQERSPSSSLDPAFQAELQRAARAGTRKLLILIGIAVMLFVLLEFTPAGERVRDWPALYELMAGGDGEAALWFVGVTIALMMAGTPRLLFYALGGFAFGFWVGLALALVASLIASWLVFRIARWGGRDWLRRRFGGHRLFARIVGTRPTALSVALVRCLPSPCFAGAARARDEGLASNIARLGCPDRPAVPAGVPDSHHRAERSRGLRPAPQHRLRDGHDVGRQLARPARHPSRRSPRSSASTVWR